VQDAGWLVQSCGQSGFAAATKLELDESRLFTPARSSPPSVALRHQNQPPDGSRPLMRRYVTKLP
jgi:hypothetical protein